MLKISKYVLADIIKNKAIIAFALLLMVITWGVFYFESSQSKAIVSLMSVMTITIPLVAIVFTTVYFYNSLEFIELLLAQPISRTTIYMGVYAGVVFAFLAAFLIGVGIPVLVNAPDSTGAFLVVSGSFLTVSFIGLALLSSVATRDKSKGIGMALLIWFYFSIIYDALILGVLMVFNDYPLEKTIISLSMFNPIDLSRILILLKLDVSALMGFTGALYKQFFGGVLGILISAFIQFIWCFWPVYVGLRIFKKKNI